MAATIPSASLVPVQPALGGYLAGYRGLTREPYTPPGGAASQGAAEQGRKLGRGRGRGPDRCARVDL
jgi:hypothetical protein